MRNRVLLVSLVVSGALWFPLHSYAATCRGDDLSPRELARNADYVFQGTAGSAKVLRSGKWKAVRFSVDRTWKDPYLAVVAVRMPARGPCAPVVQQGLTYTVFANARGEGFLAPGPSSVVEGEINPDRYGLRPSDLGAPGRVPLTSVETGDASGWVWLIVFVFVLIAVGGTVLNRWMQDKRRQEIAFLGSQQGLAFTRYDPGTGVGGEAFDLLHRGDGRGFENFLVGTWHGTEVAEFDYWYYEESHDSKGGRHRTYYRFSCVVVPVDAACPHLTIGPEGILGRLADHLGFKDIEFESEEFNRRFTVRSADERFASAVIDQRMIQHLLATGTACSYEVAGDRALVYIERLAPEHLITLLGVAKGFADHVPRVVSSLYALGGRGVRLQADARPLDGEGFR
jgi:hypothetical protein